MPFETNVFINCPFDDKFYPLLRPLLFTIIYLGLTPRIASASLDSAEQRLTKILSLILESKYSIHDLSRIKAEEPGEIFRLNMPFELGLDVGCRHFKGEGWSDKKCLILEAERYRYQQAISDISGSDIATHKNEPEEIVVACRNWLSGQLGLKSAGPAKIWGAFNEFMADNYDKLTARGFSKKNINELPVNELINGMQEWVRTAA